MVHGYICIQIAAGIRKILNKQRVVSEKNKVTYCIVLNLSTRVQKGGHFHNAFLPLLLIQRGSHVLNSVGILFAFGERERGRTDMRKAEKRANLVCGHFPEKCGHFLKISYKFKFWVQNLNKINNFLVFTLEVCLYWYNYVLWG